MKRSILSILVLLPCLLLFSSSATAQQTHRCTELPPIAWDSAPTSEIRVVVDISLPRVTSAKELYLNAMCGAQPAAVWDLVLQGKGGVLEIPRPLADALNEAVPYMPRVDYMYVRGGGAGREVAVVLFANGYEGPFFELDRSGDDNPWTEAMVKRAETVWNGLPYEIMRRSSHWLHDVALFDQEFTVHLRLLNGLIDIPVYTQGHGRGLATWLGTLFSSVKNTRMPLNFWAHEMGHYIDYEMNSVKHFAYTPEGSFQAIAKKNGTILGVPVPFWFELKHAEARRWRDEHGGCENRGAWDTAPWGFATHYGMCGEMSGEDFADSVVLALGVTQYIRETEYATLPWAGYRSDYFDPDRLFDRTGGSDASMMAEKVDYIYDRLKIHPTLPQDADGDGVTYVYGEDVADCSDINPVDGECDASGCSSDAECDDGDACTVDRCRGGECSRTIRDSDGDGSPDSACGGPDCDDDDPTVAVGTTRPCTGACNLEGEQQCVAGAWTECSAPTTCECDPDAPPEIIGCGNCSVQERHCRPDGTWAPLTDCQPIDPAADGCAPGETRVTQDGCSDRMCSGRSIPREREETCNSSCNWEETQECTLTEPTSAEVCNGADDDCDYETDEGCVAGVNWVGQAPEPIVMGDYPYGDGFPNEGNCPHGHALVGFRLQESTFTTIGASYDVLGSVQPLCKKVELTAELSQGELEYGVATAGSLVELPRHGQYSDYDQSFQCPQGQVVRGISAYRGWFIDRIQVHCAELVVNGDIGSYTLDRRNGLSSAAMVRGTDLNDAYHCAGDAVATGLRTRTGDVVDGIGLNCSNVDVALK